MNLRAKSAAFVPAPRGWLYFDANSVGAMPKTAPARMGRLLEEWRTLRRRGWTASDWMDAPARLGDKLAPVLGAKRGTVAVGDSTSVNLHKALSLALQLRPARKTIVVEGAMFPTDLYVAEGIARAHRLKVVRVDDAAALAKAVDRKTAAVLLSHTDYRTGARHDIVATTRLIHARGALAVWDLSHSAGAVPTDLERANADFAVGCGYKYLCGGPGSPGYLYVAPRWQAKVRPAIQGWFGHADPMNFPPDFVPARGVQRHVVGTPAVTGNVLFEAALDVFAREDLRKLFARQEALTNLLIELAPPELQLVSPRDPARRGGFVAFRIPGAKTFVAALERRKVVASYRPSDILRFGFSPLYHREADVRELARRLRAAVKRR